MEWILDPQIWIGLLTLTALEIVLGIDNIVFIYDPDGKGRGTNFLATVLEQSRLNRIAAILYWACHSFPGCSIKSAN